MSDAGSQPDRIERHVIIAPAYIPVCPVHNRPMKTDSTKGEKTWYACAEDGCTMRHAVPRVEFVPLETKRRNGL